MNLKTFLILNGVYSTLSILKFIESSFSLGHFEPWTLDLFWILDLARPTEHNPYAFQIESFIRAGFLVLGLEPTRYCI